MRRNVHDTFDLDENDALTRRLRAFEAPLPETLVPTVLARREEPERSGWGRAGMVVATLAAVAALAAANVGASYLSPRYAAALAAAPGVGALTGPILEQAGLASTGAEPLNVQATASGYTVRLFGAYADAVRTTIFMEILGPDGHEARDGTAPNFEATYLTDQFGHTYHLANSFGMPVIHFEPLAGPAATLGARLTLHIDSMDVYPAQTGAEPAATSGPGSVVTPADSGTLVRGPWNLQFTVTWSGGQSLAVPAPVQIGDTTYTFTAVRTTPSLLEITWTITGGAVARTDALGREVGVDLRRYDKVSPPLEAQLKANHDEIGAYTLLDPSGKPVDAVYGYGREIMRGGSDVAMEMDAWYPITSHQTYTFLVGSAPNGSDSRTVTTP